jgi:hypothetical protein
MFFSEEKNQKTIIPAPAARYWPWSRPREIAEKIKVFSSEKKSFLFMPRG